MRLQANQTIKDAIIIMCDGNPGALNVLFTMVDNDLERGCINARYLDEMGIYGPDIWICFKDICDQDFDILNQLIENPILKDLLITYKKKVGMLN